MVTPLSIIGDIHAFLAFTIGWSQRAIDIQNGLPEEGRLLLLPDVQTYFIDGFLQKQNIRIGLEASAEVSGGGGIGKTLRSESIQNRLVGTEQFQILNATSIGQNVVSQGKNVVAFKIRHMPLKHVNIAVNGLRQTDLMGQQVYRPDATARDGTITVRKFIPDVTGPQHGMGLILPASVGQAIPDATLTAGQSPMGYSFHLKSLITYNSIRVYITILIRKIKRFSSFF